METMSFAGDKHGADHSERVCLYLLQALPANEVQEAEACIAGCSDCRRELQALRPAVDALVAWPTDVLRPSSSLWERLAQRVTGKADNDAARTSPRWQEPKWKEVAPGISCKLLATDSEKNRVSMLVRLAPGTDYPPHTHAGVEELHLLQGELWIEDRKLHPGDYNRGEPGTADKRVWSETGCTCVLLTSTRDVLA
jgi:quercetin dioxygenase-like cupin family protein